jgi:hypothetical protein
MSETEFMLITKKRVEKIIGDYNLFELFLFIFKQKSFFLGLDA